MKRRRLTGRLKRVQYIGGEPHVECRTYDGTVMHPLPRDVSGSHARCVICAERREQERRRMVLDMVRGQTAREGV